MAEAETPPIAILRLPQVAERTGLGKSAIYSRMKAGAFPQPVDLGGRAVGWRVADVVAWIEQRQELTAADQREKWRRNHPNDGPSA